jgi:hypothetical protein
MPNGNLFGMSTFAYISLNKGDTLLTEQRLNSTSNYNAIAFPDNHHGFIGGNVLRDTTDHAHFCV